MTGSGFAIFYYFVVSCFLDDIPGGPGPGSIKLPLLTTGITENALNESLLDNNGEI